MRMEDLPFAAAFTRLCSDGWRAGYHERNGGNASLRLSAAEVEAARSFFAEEPGPWQPLGVKASSMAGAFLLVTGSGRFLRNVELDLPANAGIVELNAAGDAWRVVWGLAGGARPTSEMPSHVACHAVRAQATGGASRVLYHAHATAVVALTSIVPCEARTISRLLWKAFSESLIAIPGGVGAVPWMLPGSAELARATALELAAYEACIWQLHGVFASGATCDDAFGLVNAVDKAADAYLRARAARGGAEPEYLIPDAGLAAMAAAYGLPVNADFLDLAGN